MVSDCGERHRSNASALRAVGVAAELARRNSCLEISGDGACGASEDAFIGACGRVSELPEKRVRHFEFGKSRAQAFQFSDGRSSLLGR